MPRPKNKEELLQWSDANYQRLWELINSYSKDQQLQDFHPGTMNRNIRDVVAHLDHWHHLFLEWYSIGMTGGKPEMPAKAYTWKTTPELNKKIWKQYRGDDLQIVIIRFHESFKKVYQLIQQHSNEELFEKKRYKWTGSTSLGAYLISTTSSHYDWAYKLIKKGMRK